jgi:hypothetical protein
VTGPDPLQSRPAADAATEGWFLDPVAARYFAPDGRLIGLPAKQSRLRLVLDAIAQRFEPGLHYSEPEVNRVLMAVWADYVTLRRALIDFGLMDRAAGEYWRSGGTVGLD